MPAKKTRKAPAKVVHAKFKDFFPWFDHETDEDFKKRMKLREKNEKLHQRLKVHAYGTEWSYTEKIKTFDEDIILKDPTMFIDVNEADTKQKKALSKWLTRQTRPLIPGVEGACFPHDYHRFYEAFIEGKIATVND